MKLIKIISISIFSAVILIIALSIILKRQETPKSYFKNYAEAKASGIMDRGWIPTFIPKSSTDIYEQHSIDANWVRMKFKYQIGDMSEIQQACSNETPIENGVEFICEYFDSEVTINLYNDGTADLKSVPKYTFNQQIQATDSR